MDVGSTNDKIIIAAYVHTVSYKMIMTKEVKYGKYDFNFIRQACIMYLHGYFNIMSSITTNSFQQINDFNNLDMNMINRYLEKEKPNIRIYMLTPKAKDFYFTIILFSRTYVENEDEFDLMAVLGASKGTKPNNTDIVHITYPFYHTGLSAKRIFIYLDKAGVITDEKAVSDTLSEIDDKIKEKL